RTADAEVEIPDLRVGARRREAAVLQFLRVVAADHAPGDAGRIEAALDAVAARLRHDVQRRPADFGFAQAARCRHGDFLGVAHVRDIRRGSGRVERGADAQAIDLEAAFAAAATGAAEDHHAGDNLDIR